jgi:hypothetical protein
MSKNQGKMEDKEYDSEEDESMSEEQGSDAAAKQNADSEKLIQQINENPYDFSLY